MGGSAIEALFYEGKGGGERQHAWILRQRSKVLSGEQKLN